MKAPLNISTVRLAADHDVGRVFDMTRRCAFALCTEGDFDIRILNVEYHVGARCLFACMPFVNIEVVNIRRPSEIILGYLMIEDMPGMIGRWINTDNIITIQNHPLVDISHHHFSRLIASINEYNANYADGYPKMDETPSVQIQRDIIEFHSRLMVAMVLKIFFSHIVMDVGGITHRDMVFQRFMLALYGNFREHRDVRFYASRSGVSLKYFSTLVRQLSGASPSDWIETVLVGEAKSMLDDRQRSIKDIASELNFPDAPTFTKYFRRVTGLTPKAYRLTT